MGFVEKLVLVVVLGLVASRETPLARRPTGNGFPRSFGHRGDSVSRCPCTATRYWWDCSLAGVTTNVCARGCGLGAGCVTPSTACTKRTADGQHSSRVR
jgi:hypothetical protein